MSASTSVLVTAMAVRLVADGTPPRRNFVIETRAMAAPATIFWPDRTGSTASHDTGVRNELEVFTASALATAITVSALTPALADGAASTRNILIGGAAAAIGIVNWNKKRHIKQEEQREQARRQAQYRSYFYNKYGYYPNNDQFHDWYFRTYGVSPS